MKWSSPRQHIPNLIRSLEARLLIKRKGITRNDIADAIYGETYGQTRDIYKKHLFQRYRTHQYQQYEYVGLVKTFASVMQPHEAILLMLWMGLYGEVEDILPHITPFFNEYPFKADLDLIDHYFTVLYGEWMNEAQWSQLHRQYETLRHLRELQEEFEINLSSEAESVNKSLKKMRDLGSDIYAVQNCSKTLPEDLQATLLQKVIVLADTCNEPNPITYTAEVREVLCLLANASITPLHLFLAKCVFLDCILRPLHDAYSTGKSTQVAIAREDGFKLFLINIIAIFPTLITKYLPAGGNEVITNFLFFQVFKLHENPGLREDYFDVWYGLAANIYYELMRRYSAESLIGYQKIGNLLTSNLALAIIDSDPTLTTDLRAYLALSENGTIIGNLEVVRGMRTRLYEMMQERLNQP